MQNYKELTEKKIRIYDASAVEKDIKNADSWQEAYWIGKYVYSCEAGLMDRLIMVAYEKAFVLGLNIRTNREMFLSATQDIAKVYFQFKKYDEVINKLMLIEANASELPDWVSLYYASAQIHTDSIRLLADEPERLFVRLDKLSKKKHESVTKRKFLFLDYINRVTELVKKYGSENVSYKAILDKAEEIGVANSRECNLLKVAVGLLADIPEPEIQPVGLDIRVDELQMTILKLEKEIATKDAEIATQNKQILELKKSLEKIIKEKEKQANINKAQREEIVNYQARLFAFEEKCKVLELNLSGQEEASALLEENSAILGGVGAELQDTKYALKLLEDENKELRETVTCMQAEIEELSGFVEAKDEELSKAKATILDVEQKLQEVGNTSLEHDVNVENTLLDILDADNFLQRHQKILVIGGSEVKEHHIRGKLNAIGFNFDKKQLEFELDYDSVKSYTDRIVPYAGKYAGIIVGPCPHKCKDNEDYSSFIEKLKNEEGYPHVEEARDKSGKLKISKESVADAMMKMAIHLCSLS